MELVDFYKQNVPLLADILNYYNKPEQYNIVKYLSVIGLGNVFDTQTPAIWAQAQKNGTFDRVFQEAAKKQATDSKMKNKQQQFKQNQFEQQYQQPQDDHLSRDKLHQEYAGGVIQVLEDPLELLNQPSPSANQRKIETNFKNMVQSRDSQQPFNTNSIGDPLHQYYLSPSSGVSNSVKTSYEQLELQNEIKYLKEKLDQLNKQIDIENLKSQQRTSEEMEDKDFYPNRRSQYPENNQIDEYYPGRQPRQSSKGYRSQYRSPQSKGEIAPKITQSPPPNLNTVLRSRSPQYKKNPPHLDDKQIKSLLNRDPQQGTQNRKSPKNKLNAHTNSKKEIYSGNNKSKGYKSPSSQNQSHRDLLIVQQKLFSSDAFSYNQIQGQGVNNFNNQSIGSQKFPMNNYNNQQQYGAHAIQIRNENPLAQQNQQSAAKAGSATWKGKSNNNRIKSPQQQMVAQKSQPNAIQRQKDYYQTVNNRKKEENKVHVVPKNLRNVQSKIKEDIQKDREQYRHSKEGGRGGVFDQFDQQGGQNVEEQDYQYPDQNEYNQFQEEHLDQQQNLNQNISQPFTNEQNFLPQNQYNQHQQQSHIYQQTPGQQQYVGIYDFDPIQNQNQQVRHLGSTETYPNELVQYLSVDSRQTQSNEFQENQQNPAQLQQFQLQQQQQQQLQQSRKSNQMGSSPSKQVSPNGIQDPNYIMYMMQQQQQMNPNSFSLQQSLQQQSFQHQPQHQSFSNNKNIVDSQIYQSIDQNQRSKINQNNPFYQSQAQFTHTPQQSVAQQNFGSNPQSQYNTYNNSAQAPQNFRSSQNNQLQQQNLVDFANSFLSSPLMKHLNSDQNLFTSNNIPGITMNNYNPYLNTSNTIFTSQNKDGKQSKIFGDTGNMQGGNQLYMMSPQVNTYSPAGFDQKQSQIIGSNSIYIQNQAQGQNPGIQNQYQMNNNSQNTDNNSSTNNILQSNNDNLAVSWVKGSSSGHSNNANPPQNNSNVFTNTSGKPIQKGGSTSSNPLLGSQLTVSKNIESQSPGKVQGDEIQNIASPQFLNNNVVQQNINTFGDQDDEQDLVAENINSYRLEDDQPKFFVSEKKNLVKQKEQVPQIPTKDIPSRKGSQKSDQNSKTPNSQQGNNQNKGNIIDQQQEIQSEEEPDDDQFDIKKSSQNGYMKQSNSQTAQFREKAEYEDEDFNDQIQAPIKKSSQNQVISTSSEELQQDNKEDANDYDDSDSDEEKEDNKEEEDNDKQDLNNDEERENDIEENNKDEEDSNNDQGEGPAEEEDEEEEEYEEDGDNQDQEDNS